MAFATLIHGFYLQWLAWGALHVATLSAEYWLARTFHWYRRPRLLVKAANQTLVLYSMVALALRRVYPLHAHLSFLLLTFAFSTFNAGYLQQHTDAAAAPVSDSGPLREKAL